LAGWVIAASTSPGTTAISQRRRSAGLIVAGWAGDYLPRHLILRVGAGLLLVTILPIWSLIAAGSEHMVMQRL
jgi:hypothetical protein